MKPFNKVAIVGVGLIGGSIALDIKKKRLALEVVGVSRHKNTLLLAKKNGVIDRGSQNIDIVKGADLIILATPVSTILNLAPLIAKIISPACIITDVGSTKQEIVAKLDKIFPKFVGSHPLAGSEKRGVSSASCDIFKNSLCILTPTRETDPVALSRVRILWNKLGARVLLLSAPRHDKILSLVSHLPHALAFSLIASIPNNYLRFSASGLKSATRIALSDSKLWADIFASNQKNILQAMGLFKEGLYALSSAIRSKNKTQIIKILEKAKKKREYLE